jgi:hypothetical protein
MNMEFSKTSGSRPKLDSGVRIILRYDSDTAKRKAMPEPFDCPIGDRWKRFSVADPVKMPPLGNSVSFYVIDCT